MHRLLDIGLHAGTDLGYAGYIYMYSLEIGDEVKQFIRTKKRTVNPKMIIKMQWNFYPYCLVLVSSRNRFERALWKIDLNGK